MAGQEDISVFCDFLIHKNTNFTAIKHEGYFDEVTKLTSRDIYMYSVIALETNWK